MRLDGVRQYRLDTQRDVVFLACNPQALCGNLPRALITRQKSHVRATLMKASAEIAAGAAGPEYQDFFSFANAISTHSFIGHFSPQINLRRFQRAITIEQDIFACARDFDIRFHAAAFDAPALGQHETDFAIRELPAAG